MKGDMSDSQGPSPRSGGTMEPPPRPPGAGVGSGRGDPPPHRGQLSGLVVLLICLLALGLIVVGATALIIRARRKRVPTIPGFGHVVKKADLPDHWAHYEFRDLGIQMDLPAEPRQKDITTKTVRPMSRAVHGWALYNVILPKARLEIYAYQYAPGTKITAASLVRTSVKTAREYRDSRDFRYSTKDVEIDGLKAIQLDGSETEVSTGKLKLRRTLYVMKDNESLAIRSLWFDKDASQAEPGVARVLESVHLLNATRSPSR